MNEITQQGFFKKILEHIVRSNIYLFIICRYLVDKYLTSMVYESDYEFFNYFKISRGLFLDIGANDGISAKSFRKYNKGMSIFSIEINSVNKIKLTRLKKKDKKFKFLIIGSSNKNSNQILYQPYFKKYHLSPFDSLNLKEIERSIDFSLSIKNFYNKLKIKKKIVKVIKLDDLKLNPKIIKIDIQGHEFKSIKGLHKTIKKNTPLILTEFNKETKKIYGYLKKFNYKMYYFRSPEKKMYEYVSGKPFNVFFLKKKHIKMTGSEIDFN